MKKLFLILFAASFTLAGCYTVVQHPEIQNTDENGYTYSSRVTFYDDCSTCHQDIPARKYTKEEHLAMLKSHKSYQTDDNAQYSDVEGYDNSESGDGNVYNDDYNDGYNVNNYFYGSGYSYYYDYPWWYSVAPLTPPTYQSGKKGNYTGNANSNDGDRTNPGRTSDYGTNDRRTPASPTVSTSAANASASSSNSSGTTSSSNNNTSRTSTTSSSSSSRESQQPQARSNDGERKSNSGRR